VFCFFFPLLGPSYCYLGKMYIFCCSEQFIEIACASHFSDFLILTVGGWKGVPWKSVLSPAASCRDRPLFPGTCWFEEPVGKTWQHNVRCSAGILYCGAGHTGGFSSKRAPQTPCCFRLNTITHVNSHYISKS